MAIFPAPFGRTAPALAAQLYANGHRFDFYQAVRLLEILHPAAKTPGVIGPVLDEAVRFRSTSEMTFGSTSVIQVDRGQHLQLLDNAAQSALDRQLTPIELRRGLAQRRIFLSDEQTEITVDRPGRRWQVAAPSRRQQFYIEKVAGQLHVYDSSHVTMQVNFLSLTGAMGPLPAPYTELLLERLRSDDTVLRDFLDIFNHRLISLLYRVRKIYRVGFDPQGPGNDRFSNTLFSLVGLGHAPLRNRLAVPDRALHSYVGLLNLTTRSATGLAHLLRDYFGIQVEVHQFRGKRVPIHQEARTALGIGHQGQNQQLGRSFLLGKRIHHVQGGMEVQLTQLTRQQFLDFLPNGRAYRVLGELVQFYTRQAFNVTLKLGLKQGAATEFRLGQGQGSRLGWTTWVRSGHRPVENATLTLTLSNQLQP